MLSVLSSPILSQLKLMVSWILRPAYTSLRERMQWLTATRIVSQELQHVYQMPKLRRLLNILELFLFSLISSGWNSTSSNGADTIIGIFDTGIWPESESFNDKGIGLVPSRWKGTCTRDYDFKTSSCNRYFADFSVTKLTGSSSDCGDGSLEKDCAEPRHSLTCLKLLKTETSEIWMNPKDISTMQLGSYYNISG
ncbi:hypothetical protein BC332_08181 [Capsicum chinense]|nr:hypothetical protein BC332_08181 [Capsicum chinense]